MCKNMTLGENQKKGGGTVDAKKFLQRVKKLDCMIKNKREERRHWYEIATNITAGAAPETGVRVQSSGSQQRMADAVDRGIDIGAEIECAIRRLYDERQKIISVIEQLNVDEYDVLYQIYVKNRSHQEVADMKGMSHSWVTTIKGIALKNVQKIIDCEKL